MTSLVGGVRVRKTHPRLEAYGTLDELNAYIGVLITILCDEQYKALLQFVQCKLFSLGAYLATDANVSALKVDCAIEERHIGKLERAIDEDKLTPYKYNCCFLASSPALSFCHCSYKSVFDISFEN